MAGRPGIPRWPIPPTTSKPPLPHPPRAIPRVAPSACGWELQMERLGGVQFSGRARSGGSAVHQIGSASGLLVNLENCKDCGHSGWGWQDKAYWLQQANVVQFRQMERINPGPDPRGRRSGRSDRAERGDLHVLGAWPGRQRLTILAASSDAGRPRAQRSSRPLSRISRSRNRPRFQQRPQRSIRRARRSRS